MPVLATIAAINFLRGGAGSAVSFLDPVALREQCEGELKGSDSLARALAVTHELAELVARYDEAAAAGIDAYIEESEKGGTSADDLTESLQSLDRARTQTYYDIVKLRQSMRETLTSAEWDRVFS